MANETIIDLLTIEDEQKRKEKFERVLKHAEEHQVLLANYSDKSLAFLKTFAKAITLSILIASIGKKLAAPVSTP